MHRLRVVADDFTGACDIGAELLPLGHRVLVEGGGGGRSDRAAVLPIHNTQSRGVPTAEAVARVRRAVADVRAADGELVVKKIDTALRGHVAAEVEAIVRATGVSRAYVMAAIPEVGRVTVDGVQLIDGVPVARTPFARDPLNPVRESNLMALLAAGSALAVRHVPLAVVRDATALAAALGDGADRDTPAAVVVDAVTDEDIERALRAVLADERRAVLVGSIGLGRALARCLGGRSGEPMRAAASPAAGPLLMVAGSTHPATAAQLRELEQRLPVRRITLGGDPVRVGRAAGQALRRDAVVALAAPAAPAADGPRALAPALGEAAAVATRVGHPAALMLIGGETAYHVTQALGGMPLQVEARVQPLIIAGRLTAPPHGGLRVFSKGGSSGADDALAALVALVQSGR